ncbi:hypothetical protein TcasGA2_TC010556 [Tribolium castaneum]|uniref:Uncharacterized protein n=1 Tax=Tribolium castaneum TaxID=7070 RepID=D6WE65_TRICA|nr:hypothetical protein TcasGA2_TC010556 [Tribolium castaneum]
MLKMQVKPLVSTPYNSQIDGIQTQTLFLDSTIECEQLVVWSLYQENLVGPEVRKPLLQKKQF